MNRYSLVFSALFLIFCSIQAQEFYFGNDLSYVNQMEDCGAVFKEKGVPKDVYKIFADHGTNLVRVRLWIDPSWWQSPLQQPEGVKPFYNDIKDVTKTIQRAKDAGMKVMLGLQFSDFWADPARQLVPRKWISIASNLEALKDSVYHYTFSTLTHLNDLGLMPEIVKIGNENNSGILSHIPTDNGYDVKSTVSSSWSRHAQLYNEAIRAVRDVGSTSSINPEIALHFTNGLSKQVGLYQNVINNGITDFDIIGFSYYYSWHGGSITELENTVKDLKTTFPSYEVMAVETGYLWTTQNFDGLGNIINTPDPDYLPVSPYKQLEYMVDYTRAVMNGGGIGVVFWEPAWVSTPCRTPWGTGSSHDHVVFFDPANNNFMENGGGRWTESQFYHLPDGVKATFTINMNGQDVSNGVYISGSWMGENREPEKMIDLGDGNYVYLTFLPTGSEGGYYFLNGSSLLNKEEIPESCKLWNDTARLYTVSTAAVSYNCTWSSCENSGSNTVNVTFKVDMTDQDVSNGAWLTGQFTDPWTFTKMLNDGTTNIWEATLQLIPGKSYIYYFMNDDVWGARETVPDGCALSNTVENGWAGDRLIIVPSKDTTINEIYNSCGSFTGIPEERESKVNYSLYRNGKQSNLIINVKSNDFISSCFLYDLSGRIYKLKNLHMQNHRYNFQMPLVHKGIYILHFLVDNKWNSEKLILN